MAGKWCDGTSTVDTHNCTSCSASCNPLEWISKPCNGSTTTDIECSSCKTFCGAGERLTKNCTGSDLSDAQCVQCTKCPPGTYRGSSWLECDGKGINDTQNDCVPCAECDAGSYKSPGYIPCDGTSYDDTQGLCLGCEQECLPGEYRALCQQSAIESMHCEESCTRFVDLKVPSMWTGIFITGTAVGQSGQPLWMTLTLNTSTNMTRTLVSALLPITVHKFMDGNVGQFGGAMTVTLEERSCTCSMCGPGTYNGEVDGSRCLACAPGNFTGTTGSTECSLCEEGTFSPKAGASACLECPAWGMSLSGRARCMAKPAPPPSPFLVVVVLGSPMAPSEFTLEVQGAFRGAIAAAAGVDVMDCQITDIGPAARRAGGSEIALAIGADTSDAASAISSGLTAEAINSQLAKVGLPGITILSMDVVANDAFLLSPNATSPFNTTDFWTQDVGPLQVWAWMAIGGGVLMMMCCTCCLVFLLRARKGVDPEETTKEISADADTVIIDMQPEPMERESTLTGELVFEKPSSDDEEEDPDEEILEGNGKDEAGTDADPGGAKIGTKSRTCEICKKMVCTPAKDLAVELHSLALLASLNGKQGKIVKLYNKQRHCAVELHDGKVVTVKFKHIKCCSPLESSSDTAADDPHGPGEAGVPSDADALQLDPSEGTLPGATPQVDAALNLQDGEDPVMAPDAVLEPGRTVASGENVLQLEGTTLAEKQHAPKMSADQDAKVEDGREDAISVVASVAPSLVASIADHLAAAFPLKAVDSEQAEAVKEA